MKGQMAYFLVLVVLGMMIFAWAEARKASMGMAEMMADFSSSFQSIFKEDLYSGSLLGMWHYAVESSEYIAKPLFTVQKDITLRLPPPDLGYLKVLTDAMSRMPASERFVDAEFSCASDDGNIMKVNVTFYVNGRKVERELIAETEPGLREAIKGISESAKKIFQSIKSPCYQQIRVCSPLDVYNYAMAGLKSIADSLPSSYPLECHAKLVGINFTKYQTCEKKYYCNFLATETDQPISGTCDQPNFITATHSAPKQYLSPAHRCQMNRRVRFGFEILITCQYWDDFVLRRTARPLKISAVARHYVEKTGVCFEEEFVEEKVDSCICKLSCYAEYANGWNVDCSESNQCVMRKDYLKCGEECYIKEMDEDGCDECQRKCRGFFDESREEFEAGLPSPTFDQFGNLIPPEPQSDEYVKRIQLLDEDGNPIGG